MAQVYYNFLGKIKAALLEDTNVNTVTSGDIFDIDLNKQTIFPLSHLIVTGGSYDNGIYTITASLFCMDIVDISKSDSDNEDDVLNTQLAVITKLLERLNRGDLSDELYQLNGVPSFESFTDRFENKLAGWSLEFEVQIPNITIGICDTDAENAYQVYNDSGEILNNGVNIINTVI